MARVTYGALITDLAGSIGGVTFQQNSSGSIARLRSKKPLNPSTVQSDQQLTLSRLVALWPTLSAAEKTSWSDLAAAHDHITPWGETKTINGFQWFMACNLNLLSCGWALLETAPAFASITPPNDITLASTDIAFSIEIAAGWNPGTSKILIYATPPIRQSSIKLRRNMFALTSYTGGNITTLSIKAVYEALFNLDWETFHPVSDCNIIVRARQVEYLTGMSSSLVSALIKITP
jgi:hypothetical protein